MGQGHGKLNSNVAKLTYSQVNKMMQTSDEYQAKNWDHTAKDGLTVYWRGTDSETNASIKSAEWPSRGGGDFHAGHHYYSIIDKGVTYYHDVEDNETYSYDMENNKLTEAEGGMSDDFAEMWVALLNSAVSSSELSDIQVGGAQDAQKVQKSEPEKPIDVTATAGEIQKKANDLKAQAAADLAAVQQAEASAKDAAQKAQDAQKVSADAQKALNDARAKASASKTSADSAQRDLQKFNQLQAQVLQKMGQKTQMAQRRQSAETGQAVAKTVNQVNSTIDQLQDDINETASNSVPEARPQLSTRSQTHSRR